MKAVDDTLQVCYKCGFHVLKLHCDKKNRTLSRHVEGQVGPCCVSKLFQSGEHAPRAELNNRATQERGRTPCYQMTCNRLPRELARAMETESTRRLSHFPAMHGVSKYCIPRMILHEENRDVKTHCTNYLGDFVQAHVDKAPKNDNLPIALDCVYFRQSADRQEWHNLLHLQTSRVINRKEITPVQTNEWWIKKYFPCLSMNPFKKT